MTTKKRPTATFTLARVLRGTKPGRVQSVGYMQIIPLVSDLVDDRFISPVDGGAEVWTSNYGIMHFFNPSFAILIIPCHAGYVIEQHVQDHAMAHVGIVASGRSRSYDTAMCVQDYQSGQIGRGTYKMTILPFPLREGALQLRHEKSYSKLWDALSLFNKEMGLSAKSHLGYFLFQFRKELDQFVAEFECIPKQVGAIILVNDQVAGIELSPSYSYWHSIWPALIRECYGSLAIQIARSKGENPPFPRTRVPLPDGIGSLPELADALNNVNAEENRRIKSIAHGTIHDRIKANQEDSVHGFKVLTVWHRRFVGQIIRDRERVVYASLIARKIWMRE